MANNTDTKNPIERGCYCDYGDCDCVGGRKPDLFGEQDLKYPEEVQRDDLIRALDKMSRRSKSVKTQIQKAKK